MCTPGTCNFFPIFWYLFPQHIIKKKKINRHISKKKKTNTISLVFLLNSTMGLNLMLMLKAVLSLVLSFILQCVIHFPQCFSLIRTGIVFVSALPSAQTSSGIEPQDLTTLYLKYFILSRNGHWCLS